MEVEAILDIWRIISKVKEPLGLLMGVAGAITFTSVFAVAFFIGLRANPGSGAVPELFVLGACVCSFGVVIGMPVGHWLGKVGGQLGRRLGGDRLVAPGTAVAGFVGGFLVLPATYLIMDYFGLFDPVSSR